MSACRKMSSLIEPYADGELSADKMVEIEQHVEDCECCKQRIKIEQALKKSVQRVVFAEAPVTPAFMGRLESALAAEREREVLAEEQPPTGRVLSWKNSVPLLAAAAAFMLWSRGQQGVASHDASPPVRAASADVDQFIQDLVENHLKPEQPAVTEAAGLEQFDPEVGVPVRLPKFQDYGARWVGGNVVPIRNRPVASLRYKVDGHKVTLYVFNNSAVPIVQRLKVRVVHNAPVYVDERSGFTIAAIERRGVGYALATDLPDDEGAEMAASLYSP